MMMKILLTIHHELDPNTGAPGVTWRLGQEYQNLGHEVYYYSFSNLPSGLSEIARSLVFPSFFARHVSGLVQQTHLDVIDASTGDAWIWAKRFHRKNGPLLVTRSHGLEHVMHLETLAEAESGNLSLSWKYPLYHGGFRLWEVANTLREADLALFTNRLDLTYGVENLGVKSERAQTFVNGIPQQFLGLPIDWKTLEAEDTIRVAQIGSYIPRKGIRYGATALNRVLMRYPQMRVSFIGTGCPKSQVYEDFEPGVRDRIQVVPRYAHESLPTLLQGHHIQLFPSLSEGFSLAIPEAMACGLAVVATALPGTMEIVRDGENGILVPSRDSQAIEQALERLICDHTLTKSLRCNAYRTAQAYSWRKIAKDTLSLYTQFLHQDCNSDRVFEPFLGRGNQQ